MFYLETTTGKKKNRCIDLHIKIQNLLKYIKKYS